MINNTAFIAGLPDTLEAFFYVAGSAESLLHVQELRKTFAAQFAMQLAAVPLVALNVTDWVSPFVQV